MESLEKPMEAAPDDHEDGNGQDMDAEFWNPYDTDMEFMGNLNPEDSDDVSPLILEHLGMSTNAGGTHRKDTRQKACPMKER